MKMKMISIDGSTKFLRSMCKEDNVVCHWMCLEDNVVCHGGPMPIFRNFTLRVVSLNVPVGKGLEPLTTWR